MSSIPTGSVRGFPPLSHLKSAAGTAREPRDGISVATLDEIEGTTSDLRKRMTNFLRVETATRIVDVGCGAGTDVIQSAQIAGETGLVVGVDHDPALLAEAQERARRAGVGSQTRFIAADSSSIPCRTSCFDAARSERLFQHLSDPIATLGEMARVTRPGGRIAVADSDWASLSIDTPHIGIERCIVAALPTLLRNGYAGRELVRCFRACALEVVEVEIFPVLWLDYPKFWRTSFSLPDLETRLVDSGVVSRDELDKFRESLASAQNENAFFAHGDMVLVIGVKQN